MEDKIVSPDVIATHIAHWNTPFVERAIFGTADAAFIAQQVSHFCIHEFGSAIAEYLFYESSQGAVSGLKLDDGRHVVIKIHQPGQSEDFLRAVHAVQNHLHRHGYPCPRPILGPRPLANGLAVVEELVDDGIYLDAHDPAIRQRMAEAFAWLVELSLDVRHQPGLPTGLLSNLPPGDLWPKPHSAIFDFQATSSGAEWIDRLASEAQRIMLSCPGENVLGHTDWSVKHFRFIAGKTHVIYDWDSLRLDKEPLLVGDAARGFPMTWNLPEPIRITPTQDELHAFVAEYEEARGKIFTNAERIALAASVTGAIAYGARCEHSLHPHETDFPTGSCRDILAHYGSTFFIS